MFEIFRKQRPPVGQHTQLAQTLLSMEPTEFAKTVFKMIEDALPNARTHIVVGLGNIKVLIRVEKAVRVRKNLELLPAKEALEGHLVEWARLWDESDSEDVAFRLGWHYFATLVMILDGHVDRHPELKGFAISTWLLLLPEAAYIYDRVWSNVNWGKQQKPEDKEHVHFVISKITRGSWELLSFVENCLPKAYLTDPDITEIVAKQMSGTMKHVFGKLATGRHRPSDG